MRVFITGATGFIGTAVIPELLAAGHQVLGLARNDAAVDVLTGLGVEAHRGELADLDSLAAGARACDGVIHLGYHHDFLNFAVGVEIDRLAVGTLVAALEGTGKPIVIASGTLMLAFGRSPSDPNALGSETDPTPPGSPRGESETAVLSAADRGVRGAVVRLSPSVHDLQRQGLVTQMIAWAREKGVSAYLGEGANVWPAVHRLDAARLFVLAVEGAKPGSRLHAVAEEGIALRAIAEAIGEALGVPARGVSAEEAPSYFPGLALFMGLHNPTSSALTREWLGWSPREVGLLDDIRAIRG